MGRNAWTRRHLLRAAAGLPIASALRPAPVSASGQSSDAGILIVGAGMAGLSAARWLLDHGHDGPGDVVVIEGSDRIGGRIRTERSLGFPVELGASWIHGAGSANPLAKIATKLQLPTSRTDYEALKLLKEDAGTVDPDDLDRVERLFARILRDLRKRKSSTDSDESMAAALQAIGAGAGMTAADLAILRFLYFWEIESSYAAPLDELSLWRWDEDRGYGGPDVVLPEGYDAVIASLAEGVDIRRGQLVSTIDYGRGGVSVETDARSSGRITEYTAQTVIVTVPLGVLQAGSMKFTPALPASFTGALATLRFGAGLKLALEFPAATWPAEPHFLIQTGPTSADTLIFSNMTRHRGQPVLLMEAYLSTAARLERQALDTTVAEVVGRLRGTLTDLADPTAALRSGWNQSPLTGGGYSFWGVGSTKQDIRRLQRPIGGRLIFAGEHTSDRYPGTAHGAYRQGVKAARRAKKLLG